MALLRMTAGALVAVLGAVASLGACQAAGAEPAAPGSAAPAAPAGDAGARPAPVPGDAGARPAGWKPLPTIASAVGAAARADRIVVDAVDAWGEPAIGCFAVWLALHGSAGDAAQLADQILDGLRRGGAAEAARGAGGARRPEPPIAVREITMPAAAQGVLAFAFARPPYRGRVRAQLGSGRIAMTACFANQREPGACDAPCEDVLRGAP